MNATQRNTPCEFHQTDTEYLGFIINNEGIKGDQIKMAAVWELQPPTSVKAI